MRGSNEETQYLKWQIQKEGCNIAI